ncbi:MAG: MlaD family protein [Elusimicrobiota bacterium]
MNREAKKNEFNARIKTGLMIAGAILAAGFVIINLGDVGFREKYSFYVLFEDIADLPPQAAVKISGVEVGRVKEVELYNGRARVRVKMEKDIDLRKNAQAKIMRMGLIGHTYLSLTRGTADYPRIKDGDSIEGITPLSYEQVLDSFIEGLNDVTALVERIGQEKETVENINAAFRSLKDSGEALQQALGSEGYRLSRALDNIASLAENVDGVLQEESEIMREPLEKLSNAAQKLDNILEELGEGRGLAGKLLTSEEYSSRFSGVLDEIYLASEDFRHAVGRFGGVKTAWQADVYHDFNSDDIRAGGGMKLMAPSDRFLFVGVDNFRADYSPVYDTGGDRVNSLTLLGGKRRGPLEFYGGAIRSTGGLGLNWRWNEAFDTGVDIFDFHADSPRLNVSGQLSLVDYVKLGVSYEDILSEGSLRTGISIDLQ